MVIGAGLSGATVARVLAEAGYKVTVMDKRSHVAGNAYDCINEFGIRVHHYGPHLFHTSNMRVVKWLSRFTSWIEYRHFVKAALQDGRLVPFPVNKKTLEIVRQEDILDTFYRPYTTKMWGVPFDQVAQSTIDRVKVRSDDCDDYFPNDLFQGVPQNGYTEMVKNILDHDLIDVYLNKNANLNAVSTFKHVFNSSAIDQFFQYRYGHLPYRSIKFHHHNIPVPSALPVVSVVLFTDNSPFTRMTEWKNLPGHGSNSQMTTITVEEPCDYKDNNFERYYPVRDRNGVNVAIYRKYKKLVPANMTFIGRLGNYAYIDMDQAVSSALAVARSFVRANDSILNRGSIGDSL